MGRCVLREGPSAFAASAGKLGNMVCRACVGTPTCYEASEEAKELAPLHVSLDQWPELLSKRKTGATWQLGGMHSLLQ